MAAGTNAFTFVLRDLVGSLLTFPLWWYSKGLVLKSKLLASRVRGMSRSLGLRILAENFFKPMYGDYSKSGRAISLVMRTLQMIVYLIIQVVATIIFSILYVIYILLPVAVGYFIVINIIELP